MQKLYISSIMVLLVMFLNGCSIMDRSHFGSLSLHDSDFVTSIVVGSETFSDWHRGASYIIRSSSGNISPYGMLLSEIYNHFNDVFDIIFVISNRDDSDVAAIDTGYYGLLISDVDAHASLGVSKLRGIIHLPFLNGLNYGPSLHEILHLYANFDIETYSIVSWDEAGNPVSGRQYSHWGYTATGYGRSLPLIDNDDVKFSMGGQLGGFSTTELSVIDDPGADGIGTWRVNGGFGSFANGGNSVPYADLELYLMGLDPQNDFTEDIIYFSDIQAFRTEERDEDSWYTGCHSAKRYNHVFTAKKNLFPLSDLSLSRPEPETELRALTLVLTQTALDAATWTDMEAQIRGFSKKGSDGNDCSYNFFEATFGQATINMGTLSSSLQQSN